MRKSKLRVRLSWAGASWHPQGSGGGQAAGGMRTSQTGLGSRSASRKRLHTSGRISLRQGGRAAGPTRWATGAGPCMHPLATHCSNRRRRCRRAHLQKPGISSSSFTLTNTSWSASEASPSMRTVSAAGCAPRLPRRSADAAAAAWCCRCCAGACSCRPSACWWSLWAGGWASPPCPALPACPSIFGAVLDVGRRLPLRLVSTIRVDTTAPGLDLAAGLRTPPLRTCCTCGSLAGPPEGPPLRVRIPARLGEAPCDRIGRRAWLRIWFMPAAAAAACAAASTHRRAVWNCAQPELSSAVQPPLSILGACAFTVCGDERSRRRRF